MIRGVSRRTRRQSSPPATNGTTNGAAHGHREVTRSLLAQDIFVRRVQQLSLAAAGGERTSDSDLAELFAEEAGDAFMAAEAFLNTGEAWEE